MHPLITEGFLTVIILISGAYGGGICPTAPFEVYRDSPDLPAVTNSTAWAVGYSGKMYTAKVELEEKLRKESLYYFFIDVTQQNKSNIVESAKARLLEGSGDYEFNRFDDESDDTDVFEITFTIDSAGENFITALDASISLPEDPGKYRFVFGNSWWRFFCAKYITVQYCPKVGKFYEPIVTTGPGQYLTVANLACDSNKKLIHTDGTMYKTHKTTCQSDATWKDFHEFNCWSKPSAEIEGNFVLNDGHTLRLTCVVNEGYPFHDDVWYTIGGNRIQGNLYEPLEIEGVSGEEYDGQEVFCQVYSEYTERFGDVVKSEKKTLNVKYPPRGNESQSCVLTEEGVCYIQFRSNPDANEIIFHSGENQNVNFSSVSNDVDNNRNWSITFQDGTSVLGGEYIFQVKSAEFPGCLLTVWLQVENPFLLFETQAQIITAADAQKDDAATNTEYINVTDKISTVLTVVCGCVIFFAIIAFSAFYTNKKTKMMMKYRMQNGMKADEVPKEP